ncbi:MAG: hypothetical protein AB7K71_28270 [Polyangiaceae bacterium]
MVRDTIVDEVRAAREAFAKQHNYDIDAIVKALQDESANVGRVLVSLPAKPVPEVEVPSDTGRPNEPLQPPTFGRG